MSSTCTPVDRCQTAAQLRERMESLIQKRLDARKKLANDPAAKLGDKETAKAQWQELHELRYALRRL